MDKSHLRRQVAELFIIRASGYNLDSQRLYPSLELSNSNLKRLLEQGVGGVILLGGTVTELEIRCQVLTKWAGKPILLCADVEEGIGQRFNGGERFVPPMGIAQIYQNDPELGIYMAEKYGFFLGKEAKKVGLNWVLAPVCDINNNPNNPVINLRAWGENWETVSVLTRSFQKGIAASNILSCAKHFPGHGNSEVDSHLSLPTIDNNLSSLEQVELKPFQLLIDEGVNSVMIGHLLLSKIDPIYPATFSKKLVRNLLREKLGFDGLVVSDALVMDSISKQYCSGDAAILAIEAGIDLIMMPEDADEAIDALTDAFYSGRISLDRLYQSRNRRNIQLDFVNNKDFNHLTFQSQIDTNDFSLSASKFASNLIKKSIFTKDLSIDKVSQDDINLLKIDSLDQLSNKFMPALKLPKEVGFRNVVIHPLGLNPWINNDKTSLALDQIGSGKILLQLFVRGRPFIGSEYNNEYWIASIKQLVIDKRLLGVIVYGCPYLFSKIKNSLDDYIPLAYSPSQLEEAQNQILLSILNNNLFSNKKIIKTNEEFTD